MQRRCFAISEPFMYIRTLTPLRRENFSLWHHPRHVEKFLDWLGMGIAFLCNTPYSRVSLGTIPLRGYEGTCGGILLTWQF